MLFKSTRSSGKSDAKIIKELVEDSESDTLFRFDELIEALEADTHRRFTRASVTNAVSRSRRYVLRGTQKTLVSIKNVGYKVAPADQHIGLSQDRWRRSNRQLEAGLDLLENVQMDELTPAQRDAHKGQLMVSRTLYENQLAIQRRQEKTEEAIARLTRRVDKLQK